MTTEVLRMVGSLFLSMLVAYLPYLDHLARLSCSWGTQVKGQSHCRELWVREWAGKMYHQEEL